jgi:hypothetical protein
VVPIKLEHIAWYFGSKGVIPLSMIGKDSSMIMRYWFSTFDLLNLRPLRSERDGRSGVRGTTPDKGPIVKPSEHQTCSSHNRGLTGVVRLMTTVTNYTTSLPCRSARSGFWGDG